MFKLLESIGILVLLWGCSQSPSSIQPPASENQGPVKGELVRAVTIGDTARVTKLIQMGADLNENIGDETNRVTPLLVAVALQNISVANGLILRGASFRDSFEGYNAFDFAEHMSLESVLGTIRSVSEQGASK